MITAVLNVITGGLFKTIARLAESYIKGEVSKEEFERDIAVAQVEAQRAIETAWAQASAQMLESVQQTVRVSPAIQRTYAAIMMMMGVSLFWYLMGAPAFELVTGIKWPQPGIVLEWCYGLLAAMAVGSPFVLKR